MSDYKGWTKLSEFTSENRALSDSGLISLVQSWERNRLNDNVEWSLVVLPNGGAFEQRGGEFRASFDGFSRSELKGATLSHTHVRGFPPSPKDIETLFWLPVLTHFRVARMMLPTVILRRTSMMNSVDCAIELRELRIRSRRMGGSELSSATLAESFWREFKSCLDIFGVECTEETQ